MIKVNLIKSHVAKAGMWDRIFCRQCRERMVYSVESDGHGSYFHVWTCVDCGIVYRFTRGEGAIGAGAIAPAGASQKG